MTKDSDTIEPLIAQGEDQVIKKDAVTSDAGEISSDNEINENSDSCGEDDIKEIASTSEVANYSGDGFEIEQSEQTVASHSEHLLERQSIRDREMQSCSDDSSTTKLLIAEISLLQKAVKEMPGHANVDKIDRKKAKAVELLHMKERLLNQQKEAFRREEQKRQVDIIARLALEVDVEGELHQAKVEISHQLASELAVLQQPYPIVKKSVCHASDEEATANEIKSANYSATEPTPSLVSKLFGKDVDKILPADENVYDEEYASESFEEDRSESHDESRADASKQSSDVASFEAETVGSEQFVNRSGIDMKEREELNSEITLGVFSRQSEVAHDTAPSLIDKGEAKDDGYRINGDSVEEFDYENDYNDESFGEVQSDTDLLSKGVPVSVKDLFMEGNAIENDAHEIPNHDEDAYSDEGFDSASGSFANDSDVSNTIQNPCPERVTTVAASATENSANEGELSQAIEAVVAQLYDEKDTPFAEPNTDMQCIVEERKSQDASVSISISHDLEEVLTKSIEERTSRLQQLKQMITDRKNEIVAVQKKMRVERRKEQLVAEEKLLWDEMEHTEKLLKADETELALCRQRNRLEVMNLEARKFLYSSSFDLRKESEGQADLLINFDYVEEVCGGDMQKCLISDVLRSRSTGVPAMRSIDLLDGYTYIEDAEQLHCLFDEPNLYVAIPCDTKPDEGKTYLFGASSDAIASDSANGQGSQDHDKGNDKQCTSADAVTLQNRREDIPHLTSEYAENGEWLVMGADEGVEEEEAYTLAIPDSKGKMLIAREEKISHASLHIPHQEDTESTMEKEDVSDQHIYETRQNSPDLLAEYEFVEGAETIFVSHDDSLCAGLLVNANCGANETGSRPHTELSNGDLLVEFDYTEVVEAAEVSSTNTTDEKESYSSTPNCHKLLVELEGSSPRSTDMGGSGERTSKKFDVAQVNIEALDDARCCDGMLPIIVQVADAFTKPDEITSECGQLGDATLHDDISMEMISAKSDESNSFVGAEPKNGEQNSDESITDRVSTLIFTEMVEALDHEILADITSRKYNKGTNISGNAVNDENFIAKATISERVADSIFASAFDDVVNSEVRIWSQRRFLPLSRDSPRNPAIRTNISATVTCAKVGASHEVVKQVAGQDSRAGDVDLAHQLVERLEILCLPALHRLEIETGPVSASAHALYDAVKTLALDCLNAMTCCEQVLDQASILGLIKQHVESEINELLAIRQQSERELERDLLLLSDESGAEDGLNGDVLLSQNCITSNVSAIVSKVQSELCRTYDELSSAVQHTRSETFPRTPISRAKGTSILSSLQAQQDQELQRRLTGMILNDLLLDAGLPTLKLPLTMSSPAVVTKLLEWLEAHGTPDSLLDIRYLGKIEGHGVFAKQALASGQVTLRVPFKLTMNVESAAKSDLAPVIEKYPQIPDDEVLAMHLMYERSKGDESFFAPFIASMPTTFDMPVFWTEAELNELTGTNVLLLTQLMKQHLARDFDNIHQAVVEDFPDIFVALPTLTIEDYMWAMSVIWSRAFGVSKGGKYFHVLCPAMDMFNHDVNVRSPLDDFVSFDEEKQMMTHLVPENVAAGSALHISYGQYSNAKLLYSYGFVSCENFRRGVDFWMKIPPTDPYFKLKQTVLDSNELTAEQTYDFRGTLLKNDVDERLLATLRVILMNEQEIRLYKKVSSPLADLMFKPPQSLMCVISSLQLQAFESSPLSVRNELAVYENLQSTCRRKLANYSTTLEEDEAILAETEIESNARLAFAIRVRMEDKQVLAGVVDTLEKWKQSMASSPDKYPPSTTRS
ncbi:unnamed protein product [Phytophthora fragariaefolia]|uniref:Unnamed protein product n=1 Tax=Phytophthora fragariaefolia TaxID=1490495 RepID=A0A9W6Y5R9_9STRA|nr:unnamed protein product [Phytophthora fragariaefolia]